MAFTVHTEYCCRVIYPVKYGIYCVTNLLSVPAGCQIDIAVTL